jgi:cyanophycin synthetase
VRPATAVRLLRSVERGGRPARLFGPAAAVRGLSGLHDLRRVRAQLAHAEEQLTAARTAVYRDIWTAAAQRAGAQVRETEGGFLQVTRGEAITLVRENLVELDTPAVLELTGDRVAANAYLARGGLPVTDSLGFTLADPRPALDFLRTHGRCVVKPAYGTGAGAGVTCDVQTLEDFVRAALSAVRYCPELVVERQLDGNEYRMLVLDGTVIGAVQRRPPSVVGDGGSTVTELVLAENRRRLAAGGHEGLFLLQLGLDACLTLRRQGLSPASVPGDGERVTVARAVNTGAAADCEAVRPSPALAADAVAATQALGLRLASVEIATPLPDLGTATPGAGVIEVNSTPGLTYHYHVRNAAGVQPVADAVLDVLLRGRETVRAPRLRVSGRGGRGATTSDDAA